MTPEQQTNLRAHLHEVRNDYAEQFEELFTDLQPIPQTLARDFVGHIEQLGNQLQRKGLPVTAYVELLRLWVEACEENAAVLDTYGVDPEASYEQVFGQEGPV